MQKGTKGAAEQFNRFVEGEGGAPPSSATRLRSIEPEKKDFWDSFGVAGEERASSMSSTTSKPSAIGTAAMKKGGKEEGWEDDKWEKF